MKKLWKVLIADDEPIIREGIRSTVNWDELNMEVVAEAEDGEEALQLIEELEVDILLVDLNMPIMNGLTLTKQVRLRRPQSKVIIITGHDEFSYAQEAIRLQVEDYILKPVNTEQLQKVLTQVCNQLKIQTKQDEYLKQASTQLKKNFSLLMERFCLDWIEGRLSKDEIIEQLQFLNMPAVAPIQMSIIRWPELFKNQSLLKENDRQLFLFAIENIAVELLESYQKVLFRDQSGLLAIFLWNQVPESLQVELEKSITQFLKISIQVHFETADIQLTDVPSMYQKCKSSVYQQSHISPIVRRAKQYLQENYTNSDITLESTAQQLQVSSVYMSRIIKQELGTNFIQFLTQLRIKKAIQLLNSTELTILEIAEQVGYDSQHYFSTSFKKMIGVSPLQYRKGVDASEL